MSKFLQKGLLMRSGLICVSMTMAASVLSLAQDKAEEVPVVPPPKFPLVLRAPQKAHWKVEFRYDREKAQKEALNPNEKKAGDAVEPGDDAPPPPPMMPKSVEVSKDGRIYREVSTWPDGKKAEKWVLDGFQMREQPRTGKILDVDAASYSTDFSDYRRSDFEAAEWVGKENYTGVKVVAGRPAYEFSVGSDKRKLTPREIEFRQEQIAERKSSAVATGGPTYVAYLDVATLLPIYIDNGEAVRIYSYGTLDEALTMPAKFQARYNARKKLLKEKSRVPSPP